MNITGINGTEIVSKRRFVAAREENFDRLAAHLACD